MKKLKVICYFLLCLFIVENKCFATEPAQVQSQRLVVWLNNGQKVFYDLEENPKTTFYGTNIVIETNTLTVTYSMEKILKYTYEIKTTTTGIRDLKENEVRVSQNGSTITFENLKEGSQIQIFSVNGTLIESKQVRSNKKVTISTGNFSTGVYFINVDDITYKVLKR